MKKAKKQIKVTKKFVIIASAITVALILLGIVLSAPITSTFDRQRFTKLQTQFSSIADAVQAVSPDHQWTREQACDKLYAGAFPSGEYLCGVSTTYQQPIKSAQEVMDIHQQYYAVINAQSALQANGNLELASQDDFGKRLVFSTAEQRYIMKGTNIQCSYQVYATDKQNDKSPNYGTTLDPATAYIQITLDCTDSALGKWF